MNTYNSFCIKTGDDLIALSNVSLESSDTLIGSQCSASLILHRLGSIGDLSITIDALRPQY